MTGAAVPPINRQLHHFPTWDEHSIERRGRALLQLALKAQPDHRNGPDGSLGADRARLRRTVGSTSPLPSLSATEALQTWSATATQPHPVCAAFRRGVARQAPPWAAHYALPRTREPRPMTRGTETRGPSEADWPPQPALLVHRRLQRVFTGIDSWCIVADFFLTQVLDTPKIDGILWVYLNRYTASP
jgi:hypothetical protein